MIQADQVPLPSLSGELKAEATDSRTITSKTTRFDISKLLDLTSTTAANT